MRANPDLAIGGGALSSLPANTTQNPPSIRNICCIGAGYVGGPTCAVMASKCPDIAVNVVDANISRISAWNSDQLPIVEPGLADVISVARDGTSSGHKPNLTFSADVHQGIARADIIFICVNTPTKSCGVGTGTAMDIGAVEEVARTIARVSRTSKIVVEKSTVPCHTADAVRDILDVNSHEGVRHTVLSNPEFLAEGTAIRDLLSPDRVLIGCLDKDMASAAALAEVYASWVPPARIVTVNLWSSELAKVAANAFLAQRISSINALSAVCEATGADVDEIAHCIGLDNRLGPGMLRASVGFGGSCFKKDVLSLVYLAESLHLPHVANYWKSVVEINEWQKSRFVQRILQGLNGTLTGKRIVVLGFAYKKNTGDTRESAAISVVNALMAEGATIAIYDPKVSRDEVFRELDNASPNRHEIRQQITVVPRPSQACNDAHAVVILTECDEFRTRAKSKSLPDDARVAHDELLDWVKISEVMKKPAHVFDGRNIIDSTSLRDLGFRVHCIGKV